MRRAAVLSIVLSACGFRHGAGPAGGPSDGPPDSPHDAAIDVPVDALDAYVPPVAHRKPIVLQGSKIAGAETDFPVWIDLADTDIASRARQDGTDIFFTDASGTPLDYEIEHWDRQAPELQAWVRIPSLANADTTIYVEYGLLAKASPPNPTGVFRSSFAAVWHLDDALTTSTVVDTTTARNGTAMNLATTAQVPGQLAGGITFDGTNTSHIDFANPFTGGTAASAHTISAWVQQKTTSHTSSIVVMGTNGTDNARFLYGFAGNGHGSNVGIGYYNDDWYPGAPDIESATVWTYVVWMSKGNHENHVFVNGAEIAGSPHNVAGNPATSGNSGYIGYAPSPAFGLDNGFLGTIDELRIATVMRDGPWVATEYNNQSSPSTFYTVGAEQVAP